MIQRRKLTTHLADTLAVDLTIGVVEKPTAGGWDGVPNDDGTNFTPYAVLQPGTGAPGVPNPAGIRATEWRLNYGLSCFGISPEQVEWVADAARDLLVALDNTSVTLGDSDYRIQQIYPGTIGSVYRADASDPPTWGQVDNYTVWLSKES